MSCKILTHYFFKEEMIEEGCEFVQEKLVQVAIEMGCYNIELIQDELNSGHFITAGNWPTQKDAESFQSVFSKQQDELMKYCKKSCRREMYQVKNTWSWKAQKAA